jgi:hypothetical protein
VRFDPLNYGWRLENNFRQLSAFREAFLTYEADRFRNFKETKSTALTETALQQMRYTRWTFEIESCERITAAETPFAQNCDLPTNTKSSGRAQMSKHFATVSPYQTIVANQEVAIVDSQRERIVPSIKKVALDEFD